MRPRARCPVLFALALLFVPLLATTAAAQTSATITGTIDDPNRSVLPGVTVTVRNVGTSLSRTVATNAEGRYVIAGLAPGAYELRAELTSFKPHVRRDLLLTIAQALVVNITLEVGGLSEEVTVAGDTPLVNTSSGELSFLVGSEAIDQLPLNGRNYTDLALLQPGVLAYPHRDGGSVVAHGLAMSVNGQDPRSNVYLLDGTLQNDFTNGPAGSAAGTALGTETVREFRVETNAYSAEFGRNSGGQINVLTKSGANSVDGSFYEFHRNDALDARNYFDAGEQPDFHRNQFGGTVGGPIARDRAFFFLGYEALVERLGKTVSTVVPDDNARNGLLPSGQVPVSPEVAPYLAEYPRANGPSLGQGLASYTFPFDQRVDEHFAQGRLDYSFGGGTQLFARYTFDDTDQFLPTDYPQFPRNFISRNQFFTDRIPPHRVAEHGQHQPRRLQPDADRPERPGQHLAAAAGVRRHARQHGRHRHRRPPPLRSAELRQSPPRAERVQRAERRGPDARPPRAQGRGAGRALPGQHGQPDLQSRHLHVRRPERVPAARGRVASSA